ncbi:hypothetical protein Cni_G26806 [Canna indica]|uniref:WRKY domain-containing protein n=1 Tax=Canna indica TaxID=4628 RepID=A0AAQ3QQR8_9LILI|nr:hypothetical protein Cni_G26806 [Canna indica]
MRSHDQQGSPNLKAAMEELIKGQQQATHLLSLLKNILSSENRSDSAVLLVEVLASFSKALSFLELEKTTEPPLRHENSPCSDEKRTHHQISCMNKKIPAPRRTGYRRRTHPYTCRTVFSTKIEDGFTWRKYGQKDIYGAKYPRSYYRCIHKHDQGCQVTRQVQKTEENSSIFAITYVGEHTCMDIIATKLPNERTNCADHTSLESNTVNDDQEEADHPPSSAARPSLKQESDEEVISNHSTGASSADDVLPVLQDLTAAASDLHDLRSGGFRTSISILDIEFASETLKFEDFLELNLQDGYIC